jgi:hypothetical protein
MLVLKINIDSMLISSHVLYVMDNIYHLPLFIIINISELNHPMPAK